MYNIDPEKLYTVGEVAELLRCSQKTVYIKIKEKKIAVYRFLSSLQIAGKDLEEFIVNSRQTADYWSAKNAPTRKELLTDNIINAMKSKLKQLSPGDTASRTDNGMKSTKFKIIYQDGLIKTYKARKGSKALNLFYNSYNLEEFLKRYLPEN